jgi:cyclic pyranopterin phosphate synthase
MLAETQSLIRNREMQKGDVLELARVAGIMASKKTADMIPLCHPLRLDSVQVDFDFPDERTIVILVTVSAHERTGVEMEALHAVSLAALTIYDMCKSVDRAMTISNIQLLEKSGGKSGHFSRDESLLR